MNSWKHLKKLDRRKDHPETSPPGDPSYNQPPNADTIAYASKILLSIIFKMSVRLIQLIIEENRKIR